MSTKKLPEGAVVVKLVSFCQIHGRNTTTAMCASEEEYRNLQKAVLEGLEEGFLGKDFTLVKGFPILTMMRVTV